MPRRLACLLAACVAIVPLANTARAGGPPITMPIGQANPDTQFQLVSPGDFQDLKFALAAGQDVFLGLNVFDQLQVQVFDPNNSPLKSFVVQDESGGDGTDEGAELHSGFAGYYTARITAGPYFEAGGPAISAWVYNDCRGGPATQCTITPGKTKAGDYAAWDDDDSYKLKNAPAGRYVSTLRTTGYLDYLELLDGRGNVLFDQRTGLVGDRRFNVTVKFTLPGSGGPFYLKVHPTNASHYGRGSFTLSLSRQ